MLKKGISSIIFLFLLAPLTAQHIIIRGTVSSTDGKPISNVAISESYDSNGILSDEMGKYSLNTAKNKSVKLTFYCIGFKRVERFISFEKDTVLNITMQYDDKALKMVNIEGYRHQTNTKQQLKDVQSRTLFMPQTSGGAVESLVSTFGGVSRTNELSSQYSVRGGSFDENIIYVNGMEIYRPLLVRSGQQEGLSFINPYMVESVEFSTGGYGVEYGDKMSSVLDIIYKIPKKPIEASAEVGLLGASAYIGNSTKRFSQMTSIRYKTNEALMGTTDTNAEYHPDFVEVQSYMSFNLFSRWNIAFLGNISDNHYRFTPKSRETKFGTLKNSRNFKVYFDGHEKDRFLTYQGALSLKGKVGDNVELGIMGAAFSSSEYEKYDITGEYSLTEDIAYNSNTNDKNGILGIGAYHEHARNKLDGDIYTISHFGSAKMGNNQLKWGFSFQQEHVKDKIKEWVVRDSAGYILPEKGQLGSTYTNLKSDNKLNSSFLSGYIQDTYRFNTNLGTFFVNAGVRASYREYNKELLISPRGSVAYIPEGAGQFTLRLASGIYYQTPFYKEMQQIVNTNGNNTVVMNENIKAPKSIHFIVGSDLYFKSAERTYKLTGEAYYKKLSDIIPYTVNNVKTRYSGQNTGKGYTMGIDMRLYGEFVRGVDSWISLSLMKTEQNINGRKSPLPTDQRYNLSLYFQDYMPGYERLRMTLIGSFSQGLPVSAPYKGLEQGYFRPAAYKRVDLGLSWQILGENFEIRNRNSFCGAFKNIWLSADLFNIFDMNNTSTYYWIADVNNNQYAVPNYLTGRQFNIKLIAEF